ncbi:hypothetical protein [Polaromonas sp.]|uniref:hypothetical protein n=1 Tax=Polaromonas sp. TaxID=1869339 RepID=UPI003750D08E
MSQALQTVFIDESQAMAAIRGQIAPYCKQRWAEGCGRLSVKIEPEEDVKTVQQGNYLWGVVYKEMSEQAQIGGQKYTALAWHELCKRQFLPRVKKVSYVAGRKRPVISTTIGTTKGLGIRKMSAYIEACLAFGSVDLGCRFSLARWQDYRP